MLNNRTPFYKPTEAERTMRVSSPDMLLFKTYHPDEFEVLATFPLSPKEANYVAVSLEHIEKHKSFRTLQTKQDVQIEWDKRKKSLKEKTKKKSCKQMYKRECLTNSECDWFTLAHGKRARCHPKG